MRNNGLLPLLTEIKAKSNLVARKNGFLTPSRCGWIRMHIFFSVGEPSGDQHAANLILELKRLCPESRFSGFGGPRMEDAGCRLLFRMTNLAVMGITAVIPHLWQFYKLVRQANRFLQECRPDAVILIDFSGFNWWVARKARSAGIPVFYYFPPQLWAWGPWRVARIRKFVDHVLCTLPFEEQWYAERGIEAEYVGHPIFDEVAAHSLDEAFCREWSAGPAKNVAILPGSRNREVTANWPIMLEVIRRVHRTAPHTRFLVASYKEEHREWCRGKIVGEDNELPIHFFVGKTPEVLCLADCCLMVSGSVSLEVLARSKPAVVIYRFTRKVRLALYFLLTCKFLSLPNLIAHRAIMPEFYCAWDRDGDIEKMADILRGWVSDPDKLKTTTADMRRLGEEVIQSGATTRAAKAILSRLGRIPAKEAA
jgi:lipid-A-disaccharide synthase